jgi:hypothetical protein
MRTITIPRPEITTEEVGEALRQGLGPRYTVLSTVGMNWNPAGKPRPDKPDLITVGFGSTRVFRAEVTISHRPGQTRLHVIAGGLSAPFRLVNSVWIARKAFQALRAAPSLR